MVTNSIPLIQKLATMPNINVVSTGGTLRKITNAFTGPLSEAVLDLIRVDKAFIGTNSFDINAGLTTPNMLVSSIKQKMISIANEVCVMMDHSKIGQISFSRFAEISDIDYFITSNAISEEQINDFKVNNIKLYIANQTETSK